MGHTRINFAFYKTRTQIAKELKLTTHFMKKKLAECHIDLPGRKQLDLETQIRVYLCLTNKDVLHGTEYEKYI